MNHHRKKELIALAVVLIILIILVVLTRTFKDTFSVASLKEYINGWGILGPLVLIFLYIIQGTIAIIPSYVLMVLAGTLFGFWMGSLYSLVGCALGASLTFLVARKLGKPFEKRFITKEHIKHFEELFKKHGISVVFSGRTVAPISHNILSFTAGLTNMSFNKYFWATFFGFMPTVFLLAYFGTRLTEGFSLINITILLVLIIGFVIMIRNHKKVHEFFHKIHMKFKRK